MVRRWLSMEWYVTVYGFWDRIEEEKQKQNLTNGKLAKRCCLGSNGVRMLNQQYNPTLYNFVKLCDGLNVTADYLLFGKISERKQNIGYSNSFALHDMWCRINEERIKQNLTKNELAIKCRFTHSILSGDRSILLPYFARICAELHISADYILFGDGKESGGDRIGSEKY